MYYNSKDKHNIVLLCYSEASLDFTCFKCYNTNINNNGKAVN